MKHWEKDRRLGNPEWMAVLVALVGLPILSAGTASAGDWPAFRGTSGDGIARESGLAREWSEDGPPEMWRRAIGEGYSAVVVVGERLFTTELTGGEQRVVALQTSDGQPIWSYSFGTDYQDASGFGNGARSTPAVADGRVFAASADSVLVALSSNTGELLWRSDFKQAFDAAVPRFGFGASPMLIGDQVVIEAGGTEGRGVVAFDPKSGEVLWTSQDGPASYATPVLVAGPPRDGSNGLEGSHLVLNRRSGIVALAPKTGRLLWQHPSALDAIAMPVVLGPDRFLISSAAMGDGGHLLEIREQDGQWSAEKVWSNARFRNHFNTSVAVDGFIYGFDNATLRCLDGSSGEARWAHRGFGKGSLVAADGLLFVLGDQGLLGLVAADPSEFRLLGRVQAMEGRSWTSPSLAGGQLYVRDHDEIVAFDVRRRSESAESGEASKATTGSEGKSSIKLPKDAMEVVTAYAKARGGIKRWTELQGLRLTGSYSAFSQEAPYEQLHSRTSDGELFRLEFESLRGRVTWAKDEQGLWWIFPLLGITEPQRLDTEPGSAYAPQLLRRAELEPALLKAIRSESTLRVELLGAGKIGDVATVDLELTFDDGRKEVWHLHPETWLEVAVDSTIHDFSQMGEPMDQRVFYGDFREVQGLKIPHRMAYEFGARLEEVRVEKVEVDPVLEAQRFRMPPASEEPQEENAEGGETAEPEGGEGGSEP